MNGGREGGRRRAVGSPQLESQQSEARKDTTQASQDFDLHLYMETDKQIDVFIRLSHHDSDDRISCEVVQKNTLYHCIYCRL